MMADERDPVVSSRYRELGAEEPSRELDERILAASRRGAGQRRWLAPVALAAMLVLAVGVAVQVEREKPEDAVVASGPQPQPKPAPAPQPFAAEAPPPAAASRADEAPRDDLAKLNKDEPARREMEARPQAAPAAGVAARLMSKTESPEAWLERIAGLRKQGKDDEADKALAEFRKRYPDYRLSDEMRAKVEKK